MAAVWIPVKMGLYGVVHVHVVHSRTTARKSATAESLTSLVGAVQQNFVDVSSENK